jgi:hypothetical protein
MNPVLIGVSRHGKLWPSNLDWCSRGFDARLRRFVLLGYFQAFPERMGTGMDLGQNAGNVFPHFIAFFTCPCDFRT